MAEEEQDGTKQEGKRGRNGEKAMRTTKRRTIWRVRKKKRKKKTPGDKARCSQEKGRPGGATRQKEQRGRAAWMA